MLAQLMGMLTHRCSRPRGRRDLLAGLYRELDVAAELGINYEGERYINIHTSLDADLIFIERVLISIKCPSRG